MLSDWGAVGLVPGWLRRPSPRPKVNVMRYGINEQPEQTTIKVRMVRTLRAMVNGKAVDLAEGSEHDLPEELAEALFRGHDADPAEAHQQPGYAAIFEGTESVSEPAPEQRARPRRRPSPGKF